MLAMVARSGRDMLSRPGAEELDELVHHALLAQHLRDGEHQVGGGDAFLQFAEELEADHIRQEHVHRLAEHDGFGFDAAHAPAHHAQTVDHGGVRIGADQRVGVQHFRVTYPSFFASTTCARYSRLRPIPAIAATIHAAELTGRRSADYRAGQRCLEDSGRGCHPTAVGDRGGSQQR